MKNIKWNEVTWYSKLLAIMLFVTLVMGAFCFGIYYHKNTTAKLADNSTYQYMNYQYFFSVDLPSSWNVDEVAAVQNEGDDKLNINQKSITFYSQYEGGPFPVFHLLMTPIKNIEKCKQTPMCNLGQEMFRDSSSVYGYVGGGAGGNKASQNYLKYNYDLVQKVIGSFNFYESKDSSGVGPSQINFK